MTTLTLPSLHGNLQWKNDPVEWNVGPDNHLSITTGAKTDWFVELSGSTWVSTNAPAVLQKLNASDKMLSKDEKRKQMTTQTPFKWRHFEADIIL